MEDALLSVVLERLDASTALHAGADILVLAACEGDHALVDAIGGGPIVRPGVTKPGTETEPAGAYLESITVEGFRGIGPQRTLAVTPGPGLTLVVGRNGSGKSSFVEALEVLLTGDSRRWSGSKEKAWREGWRNLHQPDPAAIEAAFIIDGEAGSVVARRAWDAADEVADGMVTVRAANGAKSGLESLGWAAALETYRPFLSYNELGSILEEGPSKLYDALFLILGLEDLSAAQDRLSTARKRLDDLAKNAKARLQLLRPALAQVEDERARKCEKALAGNDWDLQTVRSVLAGSDAADNGGELDLLRRLLAVEAPADDLVATVTTAARDAARLEGEIAGSSEAIAQRVAELLQHAIEFHDEVGDALCPICGVGNLDDGWRTIAAATMEEQQSVARRAITAKREVESARRALRSLVGSVPDALTLADTVDVDGLEAVAAWSALREVPEGLEAAADHVESKSRELRAALEGVRESASIQLRAREDVWMPVAEQLAEWVPLAAQGLDARGKVPTLKAAEAWMKEAAGEIRNQRLAPLAQQAADTWAMLRQQSNVELGPIRLTGTKTSRKATLDVSVDGKASVALSVMSQGELHALALAIFLPRATVPESPFRFLVIDDPVQAMDPSKVDGLATVLDGVAKRRQVVVFTHDDRLPEAVRRLGFAATIIQVSRARESVVELKVIGDPAARYLDDAFAVAKTDDLPELVQRRVVPGLCRLAIEAIFVDIARRKLLRNGVPHNEVERRVDGCTTTRMRGALALFEDETKGGEVANRIAMYGKGARGAFNASIAGSHEGYTGGLVALVRDVEELVRGLRRQS